MRDLLLKSALNGLYFSGAQAVADFWTGGCGSILMLHRVCDRPPGRFVPNSHLCAAPAFLDRVIRSMKARGVEFVSMDELVRRMNAADMDPHSRFASVSLDDGYRDNLENAVPIFQAHQVPFTIYVATGLVDGQADLWWEDLASVIATRDHISFAMPRGRVDFDLGTNARKEAVYGELLEYLSTQVPEVEQREKVRELAWLYKVDTAAHRRAAIMNWREITELAKDPLCTIGAHTIHHYALARLSQKDALFEMNESASVLEAELGERPRHFAYPYGGPEAAGEREFRLARKCGFDSATTTRHGVLYPAHVDHLHALPRVSLNGNFQATRYVKTQLSGLPTRLVNRGAELNVA